jgi:hypothetical protein
MLTQRGLGPCVSYAETVECWIVLSVECRVEDVRRGGYVSVIGLTQAMTAES